MYKCHRFLCALKKFAHAQRINQQQEIMSFSDYLTDRNILNKKIRPQALLPTRKSSIKSKEMSVLYLSL